jgi:hypothetical protein
VPLGIIIQTVPDESETLVPAACTAACATNGATMAKVMTTADPTAKIFFATEFCILLENSFLGEIDYSIETINLYCLKN